MAPEEFERHLRFQLCWIDGAPTTGSAATQRQCPVCRRKWNFQRLQREWTAGIAYCTGARKRDAANVAQVEAHTVGNYFHRFDQAIYRYLTIHCQAGDWLIDQTDPEQLRLLEELMQPGRPLQKQAELVRKLFFANSTLEGRIEALFQSCFEERVREFRRRQFAGLTEE